VDIFSQAQLDEANSNTRSPWIHPGLHAYGRCFTDQMVSEKFSTGRCG